jgi:hypothetical protein
MTTTPTYPVHVSGRLDPGLSRWLWLLKWLLVIPHYIVLFVLWIAFVVLTAIAFFAVLITGRYPRGIFDFNVGVLRWTWRVGFYAFSANGTDRYPPFTLAETDYPATFEVEYPEHLSRGLVLVKWWLLAIPHYLVVAIFAGGGMWLAWRGEETFWYGGGLIGILVLIGAVALLFTGRYPDSIFDFVLGMNRWVLRVAAYAGLMTDRYPPFRLDMGGEEPGAVVISGEPRAPSAAARRWTVGRVLLLVLGSLAALVGAGLLAAGGAGVIVDQTQRDSGGFVMTPGKTFSTSTHALVSETFVTQLSGPDWAYVRDLLGTIRVRSTSEAPVFVGIGPADAVDGYLATSSHEIVRDIGADPGDTELRPGETTPAAPTAQAFWAATAQGAGDQLLEWEARDGSWRVVLMNVDGSAGVRSELRIGAELPHLLWIGIGVLAAGGVLLVIGAALIYGGARSRRR